MRFFFFTPRTLTQCHHALDQPRSRQRQVRIDGRSLSSPREAILSGVQISSNAVTEARETNATVQEIGKQALTGNRGNPRVGGANLPAGLHRKIGDPHPERSATWAGCRTLMGDKVLIAAGTAGELDNQALTHEVGAILELRLGARSMGTNYQGSSTYGKLVGMLALS